MNKLETNRIAVVGASTRMGMGIESHKILMEIAERGISLVYLEDHCPPKPEAFFGCMEILR